MLLMLTVSSILLDRINAPQGTQTLEITSGNQVYQEADICLFDERKASEFSRDFFILINKLSQFKCHIS